MDPSSPSKQIRATEEVDEVIAKPRYLSRNPSINRNREPKAPPTTDGTLRQREEESDDSRKAEREENQTEEDIRTTKQKEAHSEPKSQDVKQKEAHPEPETPGARHNFPRTYSELAMSQAERP